MIATGDHSETHGISLTAAPPPPLWAAASYLVETYLGFNGHVPLT